MFRFIAAQNAIGYLDAEGMFMIDPSQSAIVSLRGTRVLDAAKGIVVALRGCTLSEAFTEILQLAEEYGVGPLAVSAALVELAEGRLQSNATAAQEAAIRRWSTLLPRPGRSTAAG